MAKAGYRRRYLYVRFVPTWVRKLAKVSKAAYKRIGRDGDSRVGITTGKKGKQSIELVIGWEYFNPFQVNNLQYDS
jgi:hypothetical protein